MMHAEGFDTFSPLPFADLTDLKEHHIAPRVIVCNQLPKHKRIRSRWE